MADMPVKDRGRTFGESLSNIQNVMLKYSDLIVALRDDLAKGAEVESYVLDANARLDGINNAIQVRTRELNTFDERIADAKKRHEDAVASMSQFYNDRKAKADADHTAYRERLAAQKAKEEADHAKEVEAREAKIRDYKDREIEARKAAEAIEEHLTSLRAQMSEVHAKLK